MYYARLDGIIRKELDRGQRIAIYPLGKVGMQAREILESRYGREAILIDNEMSRYNPRVLSLADFVRMDSEDITVVLCTGRAALNAGLNRQVEGLGLKAARVSMLEPAADPASGWVALPSRPRHCVLQRKAEECGLFSFLTVFLGGISYCLKNNLVPVVDMLSYGNMYQEGRKVNAWELFFEQPAGVGLEDAEEPVYVDCNGITDYPSYAVDFLTDGKRMSYWREICRRHVRFSGAAERHIGRYMERYLPEGRGRETVGVLCRGTDYTGLRPHGHPVQPDAREVAAKARQVMGRNGCRYVCLATEDRRIWEVFSDEFGENLIAPDAARYGDTGQNYLADVIGGQGGAYGKGLDYLASVCLLSRCRCLVAGRTSGSVGALILSEGYDEAYLWDGGYYGADV